MVLNGNMRPCVSEHAIASRMLLMCPPDFRSEEQKNIFLGRQKLIIF
jgi:hypothetical protein